jgi:hypothetical protein
VRCSQRPASAKGKGGTLDNEVDPGRDPVENGWEPEDPRTGTVGWFREHPSAFFATLGTILFVGGWGVAIYLALSDNQYFSAQPTELRLQLLVSMGSSLTLASGVLWGIAVYIWLHSLPEAARDATS